MLKWMKATKYEKVMKIKKNKIFGNMIKNPLSTPNFLVQDWNSDPLTTLVLLIVFNFFSFENLFSAIFHESDLFHKINKNCVYLLKSHRWKSSVEIKFAVSWAVLKSFLFCTRNFWITKISYWSLDLSSWQWLVPSGSD